MGYDVRITKTKFKIKQENTKQANKVIKEIFSDMAFKNCRNIYESLEQIGWGLVTDDDENIIDVVYEMEKYNYDHIVVFSAIAPFVEKDSFIEFTGEDGQIWRWIFDGEKLRNIKPKIIWE